MPNVLIIEDEHALAAALATLLRRIGADPVVAASGQNGLNKLRSQHFEAVLLDIGLPDMSGLELLRKAREVVHPMPPVIVITAHGSLENALAARDLGARDYLLKPLDLNEVKHMLRSLLEQTRTAPAPSAAPGETSRGGMVMIGAALSMQRAFAAIAQACTSSAPALISGAGGTGKSLAAHVIHANSDRSQAPFVTFRCDEWQPDQVEDALFGTQRQAGCLQKAQGGVLFLDDVADLPLPVQGRMMRELEASGSEGADAPSLPRLIAGTSEDLLALTRAGQFREDLYYQLKILEIHLPSLADRMEDIPALASYFLARAESSSDLTLSEAALSCLKAHPWPGNVRELRNAMDHAAAVCTTGVVLPRHLPDSIQRTGGAASGSGSHLDRALDQALRNWMDQRLTAAEHELPSYDALLADIETRMLQMLLPHFDDKPTRLAAALRMNRATLRKKCRELLGRGSD